GDVARANLAALELGGGECYAIGTGVKTSVNQLYKNLVDITGFEAPVTHAPKRAGDARDAQFDSSRAKAQLDWAAQVPLAEGLATTFEFFKKR
ncbi:MAG TPA: hypothetical protein VGF18_08905, partial [Candidatus Tumulicola sp.]